MDDTPQRIGAAPAEWAEILAESEAEADSGLSVPGEVVRRELRDSIARLEAKAAGRQDKTPRTR